MQVLMTILYILLFILFLSILIVFHELGHLAAAKAFNVYCLEYSIGMGPLLFKHKRKNGETQFSIRAIPFGGYVSMYGEGVELPEGVTVDESRSLNGIKPWKRAIVLLAGVTMNAVLALVFFAISNACPQEALYKDYLTVAESSPAANAGMKDGTLYYYELIKYHDDVAKADKEALVFDREATINGDTTTKYAAVFNFLDLKGFKDERDVSRYLYIYPLSGEDVDFANLVKPETVNYVDIHLTPVIKNENNEYVKDAAYAFRLNQNDGKYESFGCSLYYEKWQNNFGQVVKGTFTDFGECSILLFKAIGGLFTSTEAWSNIGGIVAVGFETTSVLQNLGFGKFLFYWGFISVNLAIFNLLPFPGLDGWQLLVLIVESTTRKKIPEKVKNIVSLVGLGLLLVLMGVVVVKDLITYVFPGIRLL